jgi:hypothetical protein
MLPRFVFEKQLELKSGAKRGAARTTYVVIDVLRKPERKASPGLFKGPENFIKVLRETFYSEKNLWPVRFKQEASRRSFLRKIAAIAWPREKRYSIFPRSTSQRP